MPRAMINDLNIFYEETGKGFPIVFSHEFGGDYRSWEPQVRYFGRRYRVITYNARGFPPSDAPADPAAYSQEQSVEDLCGLFDHLGIEKAHLVGLSMGGNVALNFAIKYPHRSESLVAAGTGSGSDDPEAFKKRAADMVEKVTSGGMPALADFTRSPNRLSFLRKDPRGWQEFADRFMEHSPVGTALTFQGVQAVRPTIYSLEPQLRALHVPTLIIVGDSDADCISPGIFMKQCIPGSALAVFPRSGHVINLEEPALFSSMIAEFLAAVECGGWS